MFQLLFACGVALRTGEQPYRLRDVLDNFVPESPQVRANLFGVASNFSDALKAFNLNVVTAESLTAGMIASFLVDVPFRGQYVYGGHAVYDSDAKRVFLGVREPNVYTEACSRQMARGAIDSSRALVGLAVTGEAGPVQWPHLDYLGVVDFAISLKTSAEAAKFGASSKFAWAYESPEDDNSGHYATYHKHLEICGADGHSVTQGYCEEYKTEAKNDPSGKGFVKYETLLETRLAIRQETVFSALTLGTQFLREICEFGCPALEGVRKTAYDGDYLLCGEPSSIINASLPNPFPTGAENGANAHCDLPDMPYDKPWDCNDKANCGSPYPNYAPF